MQPFARQQVDVEQEDEVGARRFECRVPKRVDRHERRGAARAAAARAAPASRPQQGEVESAAAPLSLELGVERGEARPGAPRGGGPPRQEHRGGHDAAPQRALRGEPLYPVIRQASHERDVGRRAPKTAAKPRPVAARAARRDEPRLAESEAQLVHGERLRLARVARERRPDIKAAHRLDCAAAAAAAAAAATRRAKPLEPRAVVQRLDARQQPRAGLRCRRVAEHGPLRVRGRVARVNDEVRRHDFKGEAAEPRRLPELEDLVSAKAGEALVVRRHQPARGNDERLEPLLVLDRVGTVCREPPLRVGRAVALGEGVAAAAVARESSGAAGHDRRRQRRLAPGCECRGLTGVCAALKGWQDQQPSLLHAPAAQLGRAPRDGRVQASRRQKVDVEEQDELGGGEPERSVSCRVDWIEAEATVLVEGDRASHRQPDPDPARANLDHCRLDAPPRLAHCDMLSRGAIVGDDGGGDCAAPVCCLSDEAAQPIDAALRDERAAVLPSLAGVVGADVLERTANGDSSNRP